MQDWWRNSVTYQIYPRSFQDSSGDGIGDIAGITARLDYVASLGVDAIWLSPIFTSPMGDMGYDVSDYTGIDPLFGTMDDFDTMLAKAHELGLKVIIDQVISHSSDQHPHFVESRSSRDNPRADWYVWVDPMPDGTPPNNWVSVFGGSAWEWDSRRRQYYLHNFLTSQPDFNFHNPDVQDWLLSTMRFWLERGVDGFRLDTVNFYFHDQKLRSNPPDPRNTAAPKVNPYDMQDHLYSKNRPENLAFLERLRALTDEFGDRAMVGEVGESRRAGEIMAQYTAGTTRLHMAYSFDMLGPEFTAEHFRQKIEGFYAAAPNGCPCWAFSNHDVARHVTRWADYGAPDALAKQAIAMLAGFEGSLCLYQAEELGQTETDILYSELTDPPGFKFWPDYKGRDGCRTPMAWDNSDQAGFTTGTPWLPIKPPQKSRNVASQGAGSVLESYRETLAFRKNTPALKQGKTIFLNVPDPLLCFLRDDLMCLYNLSPNSATLMVNGEPTLQGPSQNADLAGNTLTLGANGFAFLTGATTAKSQ
ncbi:alpha-amylase family glycosyl hydrolase [Pseudorhodobacter sp. W20_MBD10_FR17]|uniref:alpha-amylase family glycosyl hydrolase n=1 Tax=Pseudorhodobacter sp. W20_MBD10_FR17 TaxID=3240266 RepID=UPI003F9E0A1A